MRGRTQWTFTPFLWWVTRRLGKVEPRWWLLKCTHLHHCWPLPQHSWFLLTGLSAWPDTARAEDILSRLRWQDDLSLLPLTELMESLSFFSYCLQGEQGKPSHDGGGWNHTWMCHMDNSSTCFLLGFFSKSFPKASSHQLMLGKGSSALVLTSERVWYPFEKCNYNNRIDVKLSSVQSVSHNYLSWSSSLQQASILIPHGR